jgi:uncharacterized YigZ family protein
MELNVEKYKTIEAISEGLYKEKGSKFLSFAIPVKSVDEIKEILVDYRKRFFDARHVCYAYMLGYDRTEFRANDDGEPSGTAGRPILGQINSRELTNVLVIVVRYFGGVLLGTGGLITAYKEAAADALNTAEISDRTVRNAFSIAFGYLSMNEVMKVIKDLNAEIVNQTFDNECNMTILVDKSQIPLLVAKFENNADVKLDDLGFR